MVCLEYRKVSDMEEMKKKRGLAAMDPERRKAIARMGGKAAHSLGVAHQFTSDEARTAAEIGHINRRRNSLANAANK